MTKTPCGMVTRCHERCNESLRLIGGGSPGSQDSRRPRHPLALDNEELFVVEGSKKPPSGVCRLLKDCKKYKGDRGNTVHVFEEKLLGDRSIHCAHLSIQEANVGNTARGASSPVKPGKNMPLPWSTTCAAMKKTRTRINLGSRVYPFT